MELKDIILSHGETLTSLANKLGVSQQAVSNSVNSKHIRFTTLQQIANALNINTTELVRLMEDNPELDKTAFVCPHCHKPIKIRLE